MLLEQCGQIVAWLLIIDSTTTKILFVWSCYMTSPLPLRKISSANHFQFCQPSNQYVVLCIICWDCRKKLMWSWQVRLTEMFTDIHFVPQKRKKWQNKLLGEQGFAQNCVELWKFGLPWAVKTSSTRCRRRIPCRRNRKSVSLWTLYWIKVWKN